MKKSPKWFVQVRYTAKDQLYIAYAVHTNGKVEREGSYRDKITAILTANSFVKGLNLYHRYAGKYAGTDKLVGRKIPQKDIDEQLERSRIAIEKYKEATKNL